MHLNISAEEQIAAIEEAIGELIDYVRVDGELCVNIVPRTDESSYVRIFDDDAYVSFLTPKMLFLLKRRNC